MLSAVLSPVVEGVAYLNPNRMCSDGYWALHKKESPVISKEVAGVFFCLWFLRFFDGCLTCFFFKALLLFSELLDNPCTLTEISKKLSEFNGDADIYRYSAAAG